jgi:hypothetical protein
MKKPNSGYFRSYGIGTQSKQQAISTMYNYGIDQILRSMENRSDYIRKAVNKQLHEDGLLDDELIQELQESGQLLP